MGGNQIERGLVHAVQLMVLHSNAIVCWPDLTQACRDEKGIRMAWCAGLISGKVICSCPMHANVIWCGPDLVKRTVATTHSNASACQLRSGNVIVFCLLIDLSVLPPNRRVELTPLAASEIVRSLESGFLWIAIAI